MWATRFCLICYSFQWGNILNHDGLPPGCSRGINVGPNKAVIQPIVTFSPSVRKRWIKEIESKSLKTKEPDHLLNVEYGSKHLGFPSIGSPIIVLSFLKNFHSFVYPHVWAFSACSEWGLLSSHGKWASHCGGFSCGVQSLGWGRSVVVAPWLSCPMAYGIFPDWGLNQCPLHWKADY